MILSRQARDKHRENSKRDRFSLGSNGYKNLLITPPSELIRAAMNAMKVRKRHFLSHLYIKTMVLPRQARDKHRENSKTRFLSHECDEGGQHRRCYRH
jgi:hypothetical protein